MSEKSAFKESYKGFTVQMFWGDGPDARGVITRDEDGKQLQQFTYPAYKIFNIQAHWSDIVEGELNNSDSGWLMAGSDGLGGGVMPKATP